MTCNSYNSYIPILEQVHSLSLEVGDLVRFENVNNGDIELGIFLGIGRVDTEETTGWGRRQKTRTIKARRVAFFFNSVHWFERTDDRYDLELVARLRNE